MNAQELIQKSALIEKVIEKQGLQEKAGPFISENAVIKTEELEKTLKGMQAENRGLSRYHWAHESGQKLAFKRFDF